MSFAMQNPCRLSIFGSELKPEAVEGAIFNTDNLDFFILMNWYCLSANVFMIIGRLRKK